MHFRQAPKQKRQPLSRAGTFEDLCAFIRTLTQLVVRQEIRCLFRDPLRACRIDAPGSQHGVP
jgi:hypothetical protein